MPERPRRSIVGAPRPAGPSAITHSRSRGAAVIPYDRAGIAQVAQMLRLAEARGIDLPDDFELDAIQLFYGKGQRIDAIRLAGFDAAGRPWQAQGTPPLLAWADGELQLVEEDRGRRHFSAALLDEDPPLLALLWDVTGLADETAESRPSAQEPEPDDRPDYLVTASSAVYQAVRDLIARAAFVPDPVSPWPTAAVETRQAIGEVTLVPVESLAPDDDQSPRRLGELAARMWTESRELSDLDADILDALLHCWIDGAGADTDDVVVEVDEILRLRGLEPKRNARGYGAGFHPKQRRQVVASLTRLQDLWIDLVQPPAGRDPRPRVVRSRALVLTDQLGRLDAGGTLDVEQVIFRPGRVFGRLLAGPGRQVARLSRTALEYDPYRQRVEKRLIRYLSWQWRIRAGEGNYLQPYRVETLLAAADLEIGDRPARTRERFEAALDRLEGDQAIAAWQYTDAWREPTSQRPGWWRRWLDAPAVIEPPAAILDAYRQLTRGPALPAARASDDLGRRLAARRAALGWTQLRLAEALGLSRSMISAVEASRRRPSKAVRQTIEAWLAG